MGPSSSGDPCKRGVRQQHTVAISFYASKSTPFAVRGSRRFSCAILLILMKLSEIKQLNQALEAAVSLDRKRTG